MLIFDIQHPSVTFESERRGRRWISHGGVDFGGEQQKWFYLGEKTTKKVFGDGRGDGRSPMAVGGGGDLMVLKGRPLFAAVRSFLVSDVNRSGFREMKGVVRWAAPGGGDPWCGDCGPHLPAGSFHGEIRFRTWNHDQWVSQGGGTSLRRAIKFIISASAPNKPWFVLGNWKYDQLKKKTNKKPWSMSQPRRNLT